MWVTHDVVEALQFATQVIALPYGSRATQLIDLASIPRFEDGANLPPEALAMRDRLLDTIVGRHAPTERLSEEVMG